MMTGKLKFAVGGVAVVALIIIALAVGYGPQPLAAQGSAEGEPGVGGAPAQDAVRRAATVPTQWDYRPEDREILGESEQIDYPIELTDEQWREQLGEFEYYVLREKGTERAFTGPLYDNKERGIYYSRATGQPLFSSEDKYESGSGWPSFTKPISPHAIVYVEDNSLFSRRIEVVDSLSGSHLGHVFNDGPEPTGQRYCINSAALIFVPEGEDPPAIVQP